MTLAILLLRLYSLCVAQWPWPNLIPFAVNDDEADGASPVRPGQMDYG